MEQQLKKLETLDHREELIRTVKELFAALSLTAGFAGTKLRFVSLFFF